MFDPLYGRVLWETLKIAILTTVLCLIIGYPFAYTVTMVSKTTAIDFAVARYHSVLD
ncbi:hypothetical protein GCM10020331_073180 [Ectobacillus funiculus]